MYCNIFKSLLILFLILRICYTGIAKEFKREPNNGDPTDTLYRVEIKNLKTNEIYNAEYTTDANNIQVDIMRGKTHLYYKNEFFASGAFISFELPRAGKTVTEGNREKFDVTLKIEKFKRLSNFVSKEKSEKPGTIEFKITDGGDLWLTDLKNDIRITSKDGEIDYQYKVVEGPPVFIRVLMFIIMIALPFGAFTLNLLGLETPTISGFNAKAPFFGAISCGVIAIAALRILIEYSYFFSIWAILLVYSWIGIYSYTKVKKNFKRIEQRHKIEIKYNQTMLYVWVGICLELVIGCCVVVEFFPFLAILPLIGVVFDMIYFSSIPDETAVRMVGMNSLMLISVPYEFYGNSIFRYFQTMRTIFPIWASIIGLVLIGVLVSSCLIKKKEYQLLTGKELHNNRERRSDPQRNQEREIYHQEARELGKRRRPSPRPGNRGRPRRGRNAPDVRRALEMRGRRPSPNPRPGNRGRPRRGRNAPDVRRAFEMRGRRRSLERMNKEENSFYGGAVSQVNHEEVLDHDEMMPDNDNGDMIQDYDNSGMNQQEGMVKNNTFYGGENNMIM